MNMLLCYSLINILLQKYLLFWFLWWHIHSCCDMLWYRRTPWFSASFCLIYCKLPSCDIANIFSFFLVLNTSNEIFISSSYQFSLYEHTPTTRKSIRVILSFVVFGTCVNFNPINFYIFDMVKPFIIDK